MSKPWFLEDPETEYEYRWLAEDFEDVLADQQAEQEEETQAYLDWCAGPEHDVWAYLPSWDGSALLCQ